MAKSYRGLVGAIAICLLSHSVDALATTSKEDSIRAKVGALAISQVGVSETGFNRGPKVKIYLASSGNVEGQPWCGAFVCWVYRTLGLKVPAGAGGARNWFPVGRVIWKRGQVVKVKPKMGDCVGFIYGSRIGHVGLVYTWSDDFAITVEGNTGSGHGVTREGDGVHKMRRLRSQISLVSKWIPDG